MYWPLSCPNERSHLDAAVCCLLYRKVERTAGTGGCREPAQHVLGASGENPGEHQKSGPDSYCQAGRYMYVASVHMEEIFFKIMKRATYCRF